MMTARGARVLNALLSLVLVGLALVLFAAATALGVPPLLVGTVLAGAAPFGYSALFRLAFGAVPRR